MSDLIISTAIYDESQDVYGQTPLEPTMQLRFMRGKLQQAWQSKAIGRYGQVISVRVEWIDVPDATPTEEPTP